MSNPPSSPAAGIDAPRDRDQAGAKRSHLVRGETDMTGCEQVRVFLRQCRRAMAADCDNLSLDLSEVRAADSKLVACLVLIRQAAERDQVGVRVAASDAVRNLIGIYRLGRLLGDGGTQPY